MKDIIDAAVHISHPLALAGLFAAFLFFIAYKVIVLRPGRQILKMVLLGFFCLSLIAMILGFYAWYIGSKTLQLNVYLNKRAFGGLTVSILNMNLSHLVTNENGSVGFDLGKNNLPDTVRFRFTSSQFTYEADKSYSKNDLPADIYLTKDDFTPELKSTVTLKLIVFYDNNTLEGVKVKAPVAGIEKLTNRDGVVELSFPYNPLVDKIELLFSSGKPAINKDTTVGILNEPIIIRFPRIEEPVVPVARTFSTGVADPDVIRKLKQVTGANLEPGSRNVIDIGYDPDALTYNPLSKTWTFHGSPVIVFVNHQVCVSIAALHIDEIESSLNPDRLKRYGHDKALELFKAADSRSLKSVAKCIN